MDGNNIKAAPFSGTPSLHVEADLPRPAKHPLQSVIDEEFHSAKRLRSSDTEKEDDPEATKSVAGAHTQQYRQGQTQQQPQKPKDKPPPASKDQINLKYCLKYHKTVIMGEGAVVVYTESKINKNKTGEPYIYSYNLRRIELPAELKAMIFSHLDFRTLGKACMGKNTKASKMGGKIVVSIPELRRVIHEHDINAFLMNNEIPYCPAMAATLGVKNQWAYVLVLFRFMLEKGCHGCGAGVYIGCHSWVLGKKFCGVCLESNLIHYLEAYRIFAGSFGHQVPTLYHRFEFGRLLEGTPHSTQVGRACNQGSTDISPISQRWFLREHVQSRINEFRQCLRLCWLYRTFMMPWQVFDAYRCGDFTRGQNQAAPIRALDSDENEDNVAAWLEFARVMEIWAVAHDHR
ncbi:hypothetical protein E2P81_ATG07642 [Venturia nashicola]|nr:hypothetical protein E2P81_ATG07642 [Venturia nashicola]